MSDTVSKQAEEFVEDVEYPLKERKKEAIQMAEEAKESSDEDSVGVKFKSPKIVGGRRKTYNLHSDKLVFDLAQPLPNGDESLTISMPDKNEILNESHKLNRLLNLYNVDSENIADLNGEKLPVIPYGNYDDPKSINYKIDVPPINTLPNRVLYHTRRGLMKLKVLQVQNLPSVETNVFGDIEKIIYSSDKNDKVPTVDISMNTYLMHIFDFEPNERKILPTKRGINLIAFTQVLLSLLPIMILNFSILSYIISMFLLPFALMFNFSVFKYNIKRSWNRIKSRFFPSAK